MDIMEGVLIDDNPHDVVTQKDMKRSVGQFRAIPCASFRQRECARCFLRYTEGAAAAFAQLIKLKSWEIEFLSMLQY
jgi:hypothetical protein